MSLRRLLPKVFAAMAISSPLAAATDTPRAVIEMFTSQGCDSCPPADRLVGDYVRDPSVITLTYAVTYWDYLGWRDTLASPENTLRQRAYASGRGDRQVYTPQAVVDGMYHAVGSDRRDIEAKASRARGERNGLAALSVPVVISRESGQMVVTIGKGGETIPANCRVSLVEIDKQQTVKIERGENRGETITYHNVVRGTRELGRWTGSPAKFAVDSKFDDPNKSVVILVQEFNNGAAPGVILGAAQFR